MAKKVIATLKTGKGKNFAKCIKMVKDPSKGSYYFEEEVIHIDNIADFFKK